MTGTDKEPPVIHVFSDIPTTSSVDDLEIRLLCILAEYRKARRPPGPTVMASALLDAAEAAVENTN